MKFDDEFIGSRAIVTISGFPKDGNLVHLQNVVREVSDAVQGELDNVEIGVIHDAADISLATGTPDGEGITEEDLEVFSEASKELGFDHRAMLAAHMASTAIMFRVGAVSDQLSDLEEASKTDAEKAQEAEEARQRYARGEEERRLENVKKREDELDHGFSVAEKWITRLGLNEAERVHGAVADMIERYGVRAKPYTVFGEERVDPEEIGAWPNSPGQAYAERYSQRYAADIDARRMKMAKDLFGN
jgi:hypothetical protein